MFECMVKICSTNDELDRNFWTSIFWFFFSNFLKLPVWYNFPKRIKFIWAYAVILNTGIAYTLKAFANKHLEVSVVSLYEPLQIVVRYI